jgi:hypothetical protein
MVKSAIRIIACATCAVLTFDAAGDLKVSDTNVLIMASGLIVAELLGVAEEL